MRASRASALSILALVAASTGLASSANAELIVGLNAAGQLVSFDSSAAGAVLNTSPAISGLSAGDSITDIDYYPVTGALYGIGGSTGTLYRIDRLTGVATVDAVPQSSLGGPTDIDFNPAADRLRVFSANDANFRLTPSVNTAGPTGANSGLVTADGTLSFGAGGPNPNLVGNAYTNNFDGTAATTLYSIDADLDALVIHSGGPAFSTLASVGLLGVNVGQNVGFDISITGATFVSNGNDLFSVDLTTGALTPIGTIGGSVPITTIAVVPAPSAAALLGLAIPAFFRRRR